ncbi:MAG: amidohydrolase, partial [Aureliella sp.]
MAVRGERIVATGSNDEMLRLADAKTERIDLQGRTVLPGLIDSHVHAAGASVFEFDHPVPTMQTVKDVLDYVRSRAAVVEPGQWIVVNQVFITRLDDQRFPTRAELDAVAPDHPVCFRTGPDASLNSAALAKAGIDRDYQVPEGITAKVERDPATGEPTGIIRAFGKIVKVSDPSRSPKQEERRAALAKLLADYNSVGITSIAERSVSPDSLRLFESLLADDRLTCRVFLNWGVEPNAAWPDVEKQVRTAVEHPLHAYNDRLWLRGVKVFLDGGMLTGSAYMRQPWGVSRIYSIDDPNYRGLKYIEPERLYQLAKLCLENDLQFTAHSVGDGAVHALLDAYEQVNQDFPVRKSRPCITHCNFMSREAIDTMARLGVVADLQPAWLWLDGATLEKQFGNERMAYFQPYRSIFEAKVVVGGGSDHMQKVGSFRSINPYNPFLGMSVAIARKPRGRSQPLHPEQSL